MEELRLSLKRKELKVVLESPEGAEEFYFLREMDGKSRDKYLTSIADKMKFDAKGNPAGLKSFEGFQAALLTRTLFKQDGSAVSIEDVQAFPASALSTLFDSSQELNALDEEGIEEAKKD